MTYASVCTGIEGMGLGADWLGWTCRFQVEIDSFCQSVLSRNYPEVPKFNDLTTFDATPYRNTVDVIFGGFPCQPYSKAGRRKGDDDPRAIRKSLVRVVRECNPRWVVAENVAGITSISEGMVFEDFCLDLEDAGYEVQPLNLPAAGIGACHERQRIFFVAKNMHRHTDGGLQAGGHTGQHGHTRPAVQVRDASNGNEIGFQAGKIGDNSRYSEKNEPRMDGRAERYDTNNARTVGSDRPSVQLQGRNDRQGQIEPGGSPPRRADVQVNWREVAARVHRMDDDLPRWMDAAKLRVDLRRVCPQADEAKIDKAIKGTLSRVREERIKACGNGVVAELSLMICRAIELTERSST